MQLRIVARRRRPVAPPSRQSRPRRFGRGVRSRSKESPLPAAPRRPWRSSTIWKRHGAAIRLATETLLGRLAAFERLRLVITVRGDTPHIGGHGALTLQDVEQLDDTDARALFLRHAGDQFAADPALSRLLRALDGHPLSIELLAANARGKSDLSGLAVDWSDRRAYMLRRNGAADSRLTSLRASLDISLAALNPPSAAHRLIRLMALLPDGMADSDSRAILSDGAPTTEERGAAARLENARLLSRPDGRWRILAPMRELLLAEFPPEPDDRRRLVNLFLALAADGRHVGEDKWSAVSAGVTAEAENLDAMIGVAIKEKVLPDGVSQAIRGIAALHSFTGLGSSASLPAAATVLRNAGDTLGEAICFRSLGDVILTRSDLDTARQCYNFALELYQQINNASGQAQCILGLGEVALRRSDYVEANNRYEAALMMFREVGDRHGEANCLQRLGENVSQRSDHETARERYEAALTLFQDVGNLNGQANCLRCLGDIALRRFDCESARQYFEQALKLCEDTGSVQGEANCIAGLGDVASHNSDVNAAAQHYQAAFTLYEKLGDLIGVANCLLRMGKLAHGHSDHRNAPTLLRGGPVALSADQPRPRRGKLHNEPWRHPRGKRRLRGRVCSVARGADALRQDSRTPFDRLRLSQSRPPRSDA